MPQAYRGGYPGFHGECQKRVVRSLRPVQVQHAWIHVRSRSQPWPSENFLDEQMPLLLPPLEGLYLIWALNYHEPSNHRLVENVRVHRND